MKEFIQKKEEKVSYLSISLSKIPQRKEKKTWLSFR
jgi:hypothetical protein